MMYFRGISGLVISQICLFMVKLRNIMLLDYGGQLG